MARPTLADFKARYPESAYPQFYRDDFDVVIGEELDVAWEALDRQSIQLMDDTTHSEKHTAAMLRCAHILTATQLSTESTVSLGGASADVAPIVALTDFQGTTFGRAYLRLEREAYQRNRHEWSLVMV